MNLRFINDNLKPEDTGLRLGRTYMSDSEILHNCPDRSNKLYPNKGRFTAEQLLEANMVKSAFSAGKRVEHMWVKVSEVQVENQLLKGRLENTPIEIAHLNAGETVFIPFRDIEDIWIEGKIPESLKLLLESKKQEDTWLFLSWLL